MSELTPQQDAALAAFKANLHFPHGGFYTLITELGKEYQLPFQTVRTAVMKAQRAIESKIRNDIDAVSESDLSQDNWRKAINEILVELAKDNILVMDNLLANQSYLKAVSAMSTPIESEDERAAILEYLMQAYEKEVFKPLLAMLRTTSLYWELMLAEDLNKMTEAYRIKFSEYPQYVEAAAHLFDLDSQVRAAVLAA
ncbi:hypothetical protein L4C38_16070 [Vibrio kasasachensis]|uniref:hypothetical protein n=1 Tax=Vibrio kasasachensis TaxID=2910248 RepID=UPI003D13D0D6